MPEEPHIKGLSMRRRTWFFWGLVLVFLCTLPAVIFYTTGYRISFEADATSIVTTGGVYVDTDSTNVQVYLDDDQIMRPRLFRSAYYLQNIAAGQHRVVVQAPGAHTWVKELSVDPHIVTEAAAFNIPTTPRLRPITRYETPVGAAVYFVASTTNATSSVFQGATSTEPFVFSTSTDTRPFSENPEYAFVQALFASSSRGTTSVFADNAPPPRFTFAQPMATTAATTTATTTPIVERANIRLIDRGWEVYAQWRGAEQSIPYYFCVTSTTPASTSLRYGQHVADAIAAGLASTTGTSTVFFAGERTCRTEIQLDHLRQDVYDYAFFPGTADRVVLHLEEGLYVTEIDDRAWQNTQPLLPGKNFLVLLVNDVIYIKRDGYYFEVIPQIEQT